MATIGAVGMSGGSAREERRRFGRVYIKPLQATRAQRQASEAHFEVLYEPMTQAVVKHPHYLPAALMGGFGKAGIGKYSAGRYAEVCMRRRMDPETTRIVRADKIGIRDGLYDVENPTTELPADFAEKLWQVYESGLPPAIGRLRPDLARLNSGRLFCYTSRPSRSAILISTERHAVISEGMALPRSTSIRSRANGSAPTIRRVKPWPPPGLQSFGNATRRNDS